MKLRRYLGFSILALIASSSAAFAQARKEHHRVVFAMVSGDETDWTMTIRNIDHLLVQFPVGSTEVEIVAYGSGLPFEKKGSSAEAGILELEDKGVRFVACANSMRRMNLTVADLVKGVTVVPSGIVEVITKQEEGWSYIKAGR